MVDFVFNDEVIYALTQWGDGESLQHDQALGAAGW